MAEQKVKQNKKKKEVEELELKIKDLENEVLTAKADLINYRKRKDEEVSNTLKYANKDLLCSLLTIMDNFERAIAIDDNNLNDELSKFLSGFKMIYASLEEILKSNGVKEIECLGKKFDSNYENCLFTDSDKDYENDVVLDVLMKGYTYNDKILRHASVKVNKIDDVNIENKEVKEKNNENKEKESEEK